MSEHAPIFERYLARPNRRRLARVVKAYYSIVWQAALRITRNREEAGDVSQDVFLKLLLDPPPPGSVRSPEGYLVSQALGRAANLRRSARRREARELRGSEVARHEGLPAEDLEALQAALASLPDELRVTLELRYFGGLQNREIAAVLGLAERTVEDRLQRGRETLRKSLARLCPGVAPFLDRLETERPEKSPAILPRLLRLTAMGTALAARSAVRPAAVGAGSAVAGKLAVAAAIVLLLGGGGAAWWFHRKVAAPLAATSRPPAGGAAQEAVDAGAAAPARAAPASPKTPAAAPAGPPRPVLEGLVWDDEGRPIAGAKVVFSAEIKEEEAASLRERGFGDVLAGEIRREAECDEAGEYRFQGLPSVKGRLIAGKPPFLLKHPHPADLSTGEKVEANLVLYWPHRIHGQVSARESSAPLAGAQIWVDFNALDYAVIKSYEFRQKDGANPPHRFITDRGGGYDTGAQLILREDWFDVWAAAPGYALSRTRLFRKDFDSYQAVLDFDLEPELPASVLVVDPSGLPVEGASVRVPLDLSLGDTKSGSDGRARIEHLPVQSIGFTVSKEGYRSAEDLSLGPAPASDVRVVLVPEPQDAPIEVRLVFDDAVPAEFRQMREVRLEKLEGGKTVQIVRDAKREPGEGLRYTFRPKERGRFRACREDGVFSTRSEPFEYNGTAPVQVELRVGLGAHVSGIVVRAQSGEPVSGVPVTARFVGPDEARWNWTTHSILNGFTFPMPPGNSTRTKSGPDGRFVVPLAGDEASRWGKNRARISAGSREHGWSEEIGFEFGEDTVLEDLRIELIAGGIIEGRVTGPDGVPARSEALAAYDARGILVWTRTDNAGRYRIERLRPGWYLVEPIGFSANPPGEGISLSGGPEDRPSPEEAFERPVEVRDGEVTTWDLDLGKQRLGEVEGTLAASVPQKGRLFWGRTVRGRMIFNCLWLQVDGRDFRLERLLPGSYHLIFEGERMGEFIADATVDVKRASVARVALDTPSSTLFMPIAGPDKLSEVEVARVERTGDPRTGSWTGFRVEPAEGGLRVEGLPEGSVKLLLLAPGFQQTWTAPIGVSRGGPASSPPVALERGRDIRLRLRKPDGTAPAAVNVYAGDPSTQIPFAFTIRRPSSGLWVLSAFPSGRFEVVINGGSEFEPARTTVDVPTDRDAEAEVTLAPAR